MVSAVGVRAAGFAAFAAQAVELGEAVLAVVGPGKAFVIAGELVEPVAPEQPGKALAVGAVLAGSAAGCIFLRSHLLCW